MYSIIAILLCCAVSVSVNELTNEVDRLRETDKCNQDTIRHYDAELTVFTSSVLFDVTLRCC